MTYDFSKAAMQLADASQSFSEQKLWRGEFTAYLGKGTGAGTIVNPLNPAAREVFYYEIRNGAVQPYGVAILWDAAPIPYENSVANEGKAIRLGYPPGSTQLYVRGMAQDTGGFFSGLTPLDAKVNTASGITQLTGDGTAGPGTGSQALTLANTAVAAGSYTNASVTFDAKGRATAASSGATPVKQAPSADADNTIQPTASTVTALTLKGAASQSDPLLDVRTSGGVQLAQIAANGDLFASDFTPQSSSVGLVSDAFNCTGAGFFVLAAETGTSDNLATVNGTATYGRQVCLKAAAGHTITVKHSTGNIFLNSGADFSLSGEKVLLLIHNGTNFAGMG